MPASLTVDTAETAVDITPEVPTSVIYADHSRPVRSGNADQTTSSTGMLSAPIEPTQTDRVRLEWLAEVASLDNVQAPSGIPRHRWQLFLSISARHGPNARPTWAGMLTPCSDVIQYALWITCRAPGAVVFRPFHRLDATVVAVAPPHDAGIRPMLPQAFGHVLDDGPHLRALRGARRTKDGHHRRAAHNVIDVHRRKAAFIVMRVPERKLLAAMGGTEGVVDVEDLKPARLPVDVV